MSQAVFESTSSTKTIFSEMSLMVLASGVFLLVAGLLPNCLDDEVLLASLSEATTSLPSLTLDTGTWPLFLVLNFCSVFAPLFLASAFFWPDVPGSGTLLLPLLSGARSSGFVSACRRVFPKYSPRIFAFWRYRFGEHI
ncbi:hypothetical protein ACFFRR_001288 [Megaselia abdita]